MRNVLARRVLGVALGLCTVGRLLSMPVARADSAGPASAAFMQEGTQISVNGQSFTGGWALWSDAQTGQFTVGVSDQVWMRYLGGELQDSANPDQQPVQWFSKVPKPLSTRLSQNGTVRYLALSDLVRPWGWQLQPKGTVLDIRTPGAVVQSIQMERQAQGSRLVMRLDRPTPWTLTALSNSRTGQTDRQLTLKIDAALSQAELQNTDGQSWGALRLESSQTGSGRSQVMLRGLIDGKFNPQVQTLDNPPRLVLAVQQPPLKGRRVMWAPGLEWREALLDVGQVQFPVTWLAVNPRQPGLKVLPFWSSKTSGIVGLSLLSKMAQQNQAAAAINGGFFGRDRQSPLGAIRKDGLWISSPILNRGVIAWNPQGRFKVGRLMLQEQVSANGVSLQIVSSNSGYPQKGIARYTALWGPTYTPLLPNEQIIEVVNQRVQSVQVGHEGMTFAIPRNGALLVIRAVPVAAALALGNQVEYQARTSLPEYEAFPNIVGAGPVLIDNGQVVVDAIAEQFSPGFAQQRADRSGIGQTADGTVLLAVTHNRVGGPGPSLAEWAQVMQRLGAINALNLDGGSSTALYLGGQLLDRHPTTAAQIQNGIGIFLEPVFQLRSGSASIKQKSPGKSQ